MSQDQWDDYFSSIDTSNRPVYLCVDSMPELTKMNNFLFFIRENLTNVDNDCCPFYIWIGLVIEPDSTISNIFVCPELDCGNIDSINYVRILIRTVLFFRADCWVQRVGQ